MLNEPNADELNVDVANPGSGGGGGGGSGGGGAAPAAAAAAAAAGERPSDATLFLTQQDRDAIERVRIQEPNSFLTTHINLFYTFHISSKA